VGKPGEFLEGLPISGMAVIIGLKVYEYALSRYELLDLLFYFGYF